MGNNDELVSTRITARDILDCEHDAEGFNTVFKPMPLTEAVMKKLRRVYRPPHLYAAIEFDCQPPGERQVNNNFWSRDLHQGFARLHLSPSYASNQAHDALPAEARDHEPPEFWFVWLCASGTGNSWFLSVVDIHRDGRIRFVHELQNLFYWIERKELILRS